jgi:hypothetical protein
LIGFGLEVGERSAEIDVEKSFASREERKFWARVFFDLAYLIFLREIGNQEVTFRQYSAVGDAYLLGRMITRSVQELSYRL